MLASDGEKRDITVRSRRNKASDRMIAIIPVAIFISALPLCSKVPPSASSLNRNEVWIRDEEDTRVCLVLRPIRCIDSNDEAVCPTFAY